MKNLTIIAALMLAFTVSASAHFNGGNEWKEKMRSEKIAFLTVEMGLNPEEAKEFWPIYTTIEKEKDEAMFKVFKAHKELRETLESGQPEKEINKALDKYLKAQDGQREIEKKAAEKYRKALSVEKVAKLYVGEEKFRRQQIRRMKPNHNQAKR